MSGLYVKASVKDGVAVVSCINGNTEMQFIGASCEASARPGHDHLTSITLAPKKGEKAVVALITTCNYSKQPTIIVSSLIGLRWDGDKLFVDKDEDFVSPSGRLGQVHSSGTSLVVTTRGQRFHCSISCRWTQAERDELSSVVGVRIVDDANLLCRYLVDQASFEQLEVAASGDLRTAEQKELARIATEWHKTCELLAGETTRKEELLVVLGRADAKIMSLEDALKLAQNKIADLSELLDGLAHHCADALIKVEKLKAQLERTLGARVKRLWEAVCIKVDPFFAIWHK